MVWSSLLAYIRLRIPEAREKPLSDPNMLIMANLICKEFIDITEALPTYTDFDAVAEQQIYNISTDITTFMRMRQEGLWWYDSANSNWKKLKARTLEQIIQREPTWINRDSGSPLYYWQEGDDIGIHPKPDTAYTDGFRCYHFKQSVDMSLSTEYPFSGSTTEYPFLAQYDEVIVSGIRYKVKQIIGKPGQAEEAKQMFFGQCELIKGKLKERKDLLKEGNPRGVGYAATDFS